MQLLTIILALGLALAQSAAAAPTEANQLQSRAVNNLPPADQFIVCAGKPDSKGKEGAKHRYSRALVQQAVQKGIDNANKNKQVNNFPHKFGNNKKLIFSDACKGKQLWEYPILRGSTRGVYTGGDQGGDRVVFVINGDPAKMTVTDGTYCGTMTHEMVTTKGDFQICPVEW
ncbi:hypothetical protein B0T14DRAFT_563153 [Immersiella caudata]|uniref:ribonuclease T1 n=1 Tax=Immersiella caudata TaxID=314043 RepID=A0AA39X523_9PEZI|nr:hypothetical protein B0T14DRAFT_563153 [Immersiella caudata]